MEFCEAKLLSYPPKADSRTQQGFYRPAAPARPGVWEKREPLPNNRFFYRAPGPPFSSGVFVAGGVIRCLGFVGFGVGYGVGGFLAEDGFGEGLSGCRADAADLPGVADAVDGFGFGGVA